MKVPSSVPAVVRVLLAVGGVIVGVQMLADGYSGIVLTLSSGVLVAELVGFGLSTTQAQTIQADLEAVIRDPTQIETIAARYGFVLRPPAKPPGSP